MDSFRQKEEISHDAKLMPRLPVLFLALLCLSGASITQGAGTPDSTSPLTATDLFKLKQLESPVLSPDGKWVVYVVRSIESKSATDQRPINRSQLWVAATDGQSPPRALVASEAADSNPTWSPKGDRIAFVRIAEEKRPQIYLLEFSTRKVSQLTTLETGSSDPHWSPDGSQILFSGSLSDIQVRKVQAKREQANSPVAESGKLENKPTNPAGSETRVASATAMDRDLATAMANPDGTMPEIRAWLGKNRAQDNPRAADWLGARAGSAFEPLPDFKQLYVVNARERSTPEAITPDDDNYNDGRWLADGKRIVCIGPRKTKDKAERAAMNSLYVIEIATRKARTLLEEIGSNYGEPSPSPDGKWIAYTQTSGGEFTFEQAVVAVIASESDRPMILTAPIDRTATNLKWSPDGTAIYFIAADRGCYPLYRVALDHERAQSLTPDRTWGIRDYDVGAHDIIQVVTHPGNPWELYRSTRDGKTSVPLTTHNSAWLKEKKLSAYEPHRFETSEGIMVDYWTLKPAVFDSGKKYPLLVAIHDGPAMMWGPGEASNWFEMQFLAARGYTVMFCNPRGSDGYGRDFQHANFRDWGIGPSRDELFAAGFASKEPYVDASRQGVIGNSYGGYLTAWLIGHDARFNAAVVQNGIYDLPVFFGTSFEHFQVPRYWGGYSWQKEVRALLDRDSPITYVENIKTPLLIMQSDANSLGETVQSQLLYRDLKQLGRPVEYISYPATVPAQDHTANPEQTLEQLVRSEEFLRRHLGENQTPDLLPSAR